MSTNRGFDADHRRVDDGYDDRGRDDGRTERLRTGDDARDERLYERDRRYEDDRVAGDRVAGEGAYAVDDPAYHDDRLDAGAARFGGVKFGSAFFGWLAAIRAGHARLQAGLKVPCPVLVLSSDRSSAPKEMGEDVHSTDIVLDVRQIRRWATAVGKHVTYVAIPGAIHDVVLSRRPARERAYDEIAKWLGAYVD